MESLNIVEVNYGDLTGRIFNGYDLHLSLNEIPGISAVQYVAEKNSDTPTVIRFKDDRVIREERYDLEQRFSVGQLLSPYGLQLLQEDAFLRADVVHFHILHNNTISLLDLPRLMERGNAVWTLHDLWPITGNCIQPLACDRWKTGCGHCENMTPVGRELCADTTAQMWRLKKAIFSQINPYIVVASPFVERYIRESPLTSHWQHIVRIPFGLKNCFFEEFSQAECREKYGIDPDCIVIGFRLSDSELKGGRYILDALKQLKSSRPIQLLTVGNIDGLPDWLVEKYACKCLPWLSEEEILSYYHALDIFLMPSLAESFGLMAIEAMACETAVICFQTTGLEFIVQAPRCGVAVEYCSALAIQKALSRLIDNPEELLARKRRGKAFIAENYRYDDYVKRHLKLYRDIASKKFL